MLGKTDFFLISRANASILKFENKKKLVGPSFAGLSKLGVIISQIEAVDSKQLEERKKLRFKEIIFKNAFLKRSRIGLKLRQSVYSFCFLNLATFLLYVCSKKNDDALLSKPGLRKIFC